LNPLPKQDLVLTGVSHITYIKGFILGEKTWEDQNKEDFQLSGKLYNRESQIETLKQIYHLMTQNQMEIVFIAGYPGTGKTSLACRFLEYAEGNNALCSAGKFDQNNQDMPYIAFVQAFQGIIRKILMEDQQVIAWWREKIVQALHPNVQVMVDIVPELSLIVGPQPPVQDLPPVELQNRFDAVFVKLLQLFGDQKSPLVLFLDDLQWADFSSIRLLQQITREKNMKHIMIVGAYRDNAIDAAHPLSRLFDSIIQTGQNIQIVTLQPLELVHTNQLIGELLHCQAEASKELAELCMDKTKGNPFFLIQFLYSLKDNRLIRFDRNKRQWVWDMAAIRSLEVTANVVDLMINKILKLSQAVIEILQYAACMNNRFDLHSLSIVMGKKPEEVASYLRNAVDAGLLIKNEDYYSFLHDRVQQAAYAVLSDPVKSLFHYRIGKSLYQNLTEQERQTRLFEITDHFNRGGNCIPGQTEYLFLFELNLQAGRKAKLLSDFPRALDYYLHALDLFDHNIWRTDYSTGLELHIEAAEAAYICSKYDLMEEITSKALSQCRDILDKARIYEITIQAYTAQNKLEKALDRFREIMRHMGIIVPHNPTLRHIILEYLKTTLALRRRKSHELQEIPVMTSPKYITGMRIIVSIGMASYATSHYTFLLCVFKAIQLSLKYGITEQTAVAYAGYGCITSCLNQTKLGYQFFQLAFSTQNRLGGKKYDSVIKILYNMVAWHWEKAQRLQEFPSSYHSGIAVGNLLSAGHSIMQYFVYSCLLGKEIPLIEADIDNYYNNLLKTGHDTSIQVTSIYIQALMNFKQVTHNPIELMGEYFNEETHQPKYLESNDRTVLFSIYFQKMILSYYFRNYQEAMKYLAKAELYLDGVLATICIPLTHFYKALILAANYDDMKWRKKWSAIWQINRSIKQVKKLAASSPGVFLPKLYLMKAEKARILGNHQKAGEYYDKSIEAARIQGFIPEEGLACEMAARFYFSIGRDMPARNYLNHACNCYHRWGAISKVVDLQNQFGIPEPVTALSSMDA
jgi:predicted ATPase